MDPLRLKVTMSYSSEEEDYSCKHTMSNCNCYEDDNEVIHQDECWCCNKTITGHQYRTPHIHGGWSGYFCSWECVEINNEKGGGNSMGRQCYINQFKNVGEYWTATNPGY